MAIRDQTLNETAAQVFRERFRGEVLREDDEGYDEARQVWNAMIDRYPALIARPTGTADVMTAVAFAHENDVLLSVKGGGHNIAGKAVADEGLMLDLSEMNNVRVNPEAQTARVGSGATLGDMDHETQAFGLAAPGGVISTTGVAGLTLGGGFGWLSRKYGLAVDNLRSVDIVTADRELRHASEDQNKDLFWGFAAEVATLGSSRRSNSTSIRSVRKCCSDQRSIDTTTRQMYSDTTESSPATHHESAVSGWIVSRRHRCRFSL